MKAFIGLIFLLVTSVFIIDSSPKFQNTKDNIMNDATTISNLPKREGIRPETTNTNPHTQLNQQPKELSYINELQQWAFELNNIYKSPSLVSVPGAIAMFMEKEHSFTSCNAFMADSEFAHFHPHPDYSLHLGLPKKIAEHVIEQGWGEWHPLIARGYLPPNIIMMYAPRNKQELDVSKAILKCSYDFAKGKYE